MATSLPSCVVLSIHPYYRGFGFAILDPSCGLVDWGVARLYSKQADEFLKRLSDLLHEHVPALLVGEDWRGTGRRAASSGKMKLALRLAEATGIATRLVSRRSVFEKFEAEDQYGTAARVALQLPELERHLPPKRRLGYSIDERMYLFAAVAVALTAVE